jgi:tRNA(His) 5'-end guanylyltransferase
MDKKVFNLGDRMKRYENVFRTHMLRRTPVIIRIDGKAFHSWTRKLNKPFDKDVYSAMAKMGSTVVNNIQGAKFVYGFSDEISILITDYDKLATEAWFNYSVQKMASVSASMATAYFNEAVHKLGMGGEAGMPPATFDARVFNVPVDDVVNYFVWRQTDCIRNSINATGHAYLGHKKCQNLKQDEIIEKLLKLEQPIDWNRDLPPIYKRGFSYVAGSNEVTTNPPEFVKCREFIGIHLFNQA